VKKGEIVGFLGPNGAGKTTTMRILTCYLPATAGKAAIAGFDVFDDSLEVRRRVGYMPESPPLYTDMTVDSYLGFVSKIKGLTGSGRKKRIDEVKERTRIADKSDSIIKTLSKGYRQRVGLAQALIHSPDILILDEPTAGLDPKQIIETRQLIKGLAGDHTIILSTHILPEVSMTCERIMIIDRGKLVAVDTAENLNRRLRGSETISVTVTGSKDEIEQKIRSVEGVQTVLFDRDDDGANVFNVDSRTGADIRGELARALIESGHTLLEIKRVGMSLEEIFLSLTTKEEAVN
jgi:ABC-2 type transport system ATP-binding protein